MLRFDIADAHVIAYRRNVNERLMQWQRIRDRSLSRRDRAYNMHK